jgi:hypothetical protein
MEPKLTDQRALYDHAIALRNDKKFVEAAPIFLQLAYVGHARAMHNYAMILLQDHHYDEAFHWFSIAAELGLPNSQTNLRSMRAERNWWPTPIKDTNKIALDLVVGSNREGDTLGPIFKVLNGFSTADHSHTGRNVTTFDLRACKLCDHPHITGDATIFDFTKYNIKSAYLERLPTFTHAITRVKANTAPETIITKEHNTIGKIIDNLAPAMERGASLEIEWQPYIMVLLTDNPDSLDQFRAIIPFHGFMELVNLVLIPMGAIDCVEDAVLRDISVEQINLIASAKALLEFYLEQGVCGSSKEIIKNEIRREHHVIKQYKTDFNKHNAAFKQLLENSLTGALAVDLAVIANGPAVITYLTEHGFENISIARTVSERTGRKNVWIIKATKS